MATNLQTYLQQLHSCLRDGDPAANAPKAQHIAADLTQLCLYDVTAKEVDYCCSVLFNKDEGVTAFLKATVTLEQYQSCKVELLDLLLGFINKWKKSVLPYSVDIKDVCLSLFTRDRFAKVKNAALPLLIEVVTLTAGSSLAQEMEVSKLINKFFSDLIPATKHSATVKQHIYHLLGLLAEVYPENMIGYEGKLVDLYVRTLKQQMTSKTKEPELPIIAGCLQGLTHLLVNFTQSEEEGSKHSYDIYKMTCKSMDESIKYTRYEMPKSGLELLAKHAPQFSSYLLDDYERVYGTLSYWCRHHNRDMAHVGMLAMQSFLKKVCEVLVTRAREGRKEGGTFKFFLGVFRGILDNPESGSKEINLAIKGYGYLAAPCKIFLSTNDVKYMFNEMIQRSEQIFLNEEENLEDRLINLPSFLEALASIVAQLDEVSETFVGWLERLVVLLMENFPKLHPKLHYGCYLAVLRVLLALAPKGATFRALLARIVYQGLIRTCSHPVLLVSEDQTSDTMSVEEALREQSRISYKDYIQLWTSLLDSSKFKELGAEGIGLEERAALSEAVYDEIITAVMTMLQRLDLSANREGEAQGDAEAGPSDNASSPDSTGLTSDPVQGLQATKPKDFIVFINLVDFCKELLPKRHVLWFHKWAFTFTHELILQSTNFPLVSGFYKMLATAMELTKELKYFQGIGSAEIKKEVKLEDSEDIAMEAAGDLSQREATYLLVSKFTNEVLTRIKQYKDDLLVACLTFVLSVPLEVVSAQIANLVPAVKVALSLGQSYLTMAHTTLNTLEYWCRVLPPDVINPYYCQILPCFDAYLRTSSAMGSENGETLALDSTGKSKKSSRTKVKVKLLKKKGADIKGDKYASELAHVKQRCVRLLGALGGSTNHWLVTSSKTELAKTAVAWDTQQHLKFDMPFMDIKPTIYFDAFLPRVVELATASSDRQTKVAACELLHSLVLYMLGRSAQQPGGAAKKASMEPLYRKVLPALLQLACDVEQVSRQLFESLMFQIIHWFTSNKKFESEDTIALLDTLMEGVVCPTDMAKRDFSAQCIREFLKWSIKQTSKKQMEKSPLNAKSLLRRIYSLARHPSAFKRLGAALAFNNMYAVFREEESLVDMYIFEVLVAYVDSLALAHNDDKSLGTQEQCAKSLKHVERIIKAKATLLNKESKRRVKPKDWTEATLMLAVRWLMRQCGRPQTECRHACMELVCSLAPCIPGMKTSKAFFNTFLKENGAVYYISRFERGAYKTHSRSGLARCPTMPDLSPTFTLLGAQSWFDLLLAALDCYTWVFGQSLLMPGEILAEKGGKKGTVMFTALAHFLSSLAMEDISGAAKLHAESRDDAVYTPWEVEEYNRAKCTIIVRFMNFLCTLLSKHAQESLKVIPADFWCDELWETLTWCVLKPANVGFNMGNLEVMNQLPQETEVLLQLSRRYLPENKLKEFRKVLKSHLATTSNLLRELPSDLSDPAVDSVQLQHLVMGYQQLHKAGLLEACLPSTLQGDKLAAGILDIVIKGVTKKQDGELLVVTLNPNACELAKHLLQLTFTLGTGQGRILGCLLEKKRVKHQGLHSESCLGEMFYGMFRSTIDPCLVAMAKDFVPELMKHAKTESDVVASILSGMLDHISRDKQLRKNSGTQVVSQILAQWHHLRTWWSGSVAMETKAQALGLLTKIIVVDSKAVSDVKQPGFHEVFDMYLHMLTDSSTNLGFKSRVLDLLVFFTSLPQTEINKLKEKLDRFVADNFPMRSSEFTPGTAKYNEYIVAINKLLSALELSGSRMLLELIISIMCREDRHVHEDQIQDALAAFVKRLPRDQHKLALDVPYIVFTREGSYPNMIRRASLERVCLTMLRLVYVSALNEFFMDHVKEIMARIEAKPVKGSESVMEQQLVTKLGCFQLMEVLYSRLPKDDVSSKNSKINAIYKDNAAVDGKEMTKALTMASHVAKSEDMRGETVLLELRRQLHCAAYNALVAIISCTQTDVKFYHAFLFKDDSAKGKFLFENLIDEKRKYTFEVEMEVPDIYRKSKSISYLQMPWRPLLPGHQQNPMARRKKFVAIRSEVRDQPEDEPGRQTTSVHYLASQYLHDSSLSSDVSHFDFGTSVSSSVFSSGGSVQGRGRARGRKASSVESRMDDLELPSVLVTSDYIEMEMDALNQHESMASATALLKHMHTNKITPEVERGTSPSAMPDWMSALHKKMQDSTTAVNIKLFIAKLIINTQEVFKPYARFWLSPIVHLIVSGGTASPGIHYLTVDLVVTMLSWHTVAIPEDTSVDRAMASRLTEFLMENCHHDTRRVLKNNLEVIKTLVEVWKDRINVPTRVIYENFNKSDPKSMTNATGVQLLGVVLANKLPPYTAGCGVDKQAFFKALATNMCNHYKAVYAAAAEVVGMALHHMSEREKSEDDRKWRDIYMENIQKMLSSIQQQRPEVFVACVHKMSQHHAIAADRFLSKLVFLLPRIHGDTRTWCLEVLQNRVDQMENIFQEMKTKGILTILEHRDDAAQLAALKLVKGMLRNLKPTELLYLLPAVSAFTAHPSVSCRQAMYDIFMWIYDNYREEDTDEGHRILTVTKDCLLKGLSDDDQRNRLSVQNFWSDSRRLPGDTVDRLVAMLEAMYSPSAESAYLAYATNLILSMTSLSPDYNKEVFEHPLSQCKFENYQVQSSWRQRHAAMTPLFVETQASQADSGLSSLDETVDGGHVRATQDVQQFTPTQEQGGGKGKGPYDWLTQSSLDTYASYTLPSHANESQASALLFNVGRSSTKLAAGRKARPVGPGFGSSRAGTTREANDANEDGEQTEILRLKKRFLKDHGSSRVFFMKRATRINKLREEKIKEQKARRESQVTMYRQYRTGDLPDIQIKHACLIAPLQALAQRDSNLGRLLFSAVFKSIFVEIENVKTDREARETFEQISTSLNQMLSTSTQYCPAFIGSVLDIAYEFPRKLKLEPASVNSACVISMQQPLGIVLLEEMLIQSNEEEEKPSKRARLTGPQMSKDTTTWIELARLYKSIGDYDVLRGIFSSRVGTQELTQRALEAEMKSDYLTAAQLYTQGLDGKSGSDSEPAEVEVDFWEEGQLKSYAQLTSWDKLEELTNGIIDDNRRPNLDKLWNDAYMQEQVLPVMLRSRLKRMLTDDSDQQSLLSFVDAAMKVPDRRAFLESRHCEDLSLMYLWQEDHDRARHYADMAVESFLQTWTHLGGLMTNSRLATLQSLQQLSELQEYLQFIGKEETLEQKKLILAVLSPEYSGKPKSISYLLMPCRHSSPGHQQNLMSRAPMGNLVRKWLNRWPDTILDPVSSVWDDVVTNRCVYLYQVGKMLESKGVTMETDDSDIYGAEKVSLKLLEANSASQQDNFTLAIKLLKQANKEKRGLTDEEIQLQWSHTYARTHNRRCQVTDLKLKDKVNTLVGTLSHLERYSTYEVLRSDPKLGQKQHQLMGEALQILTSLLQNEVITLDDLEPKERDLVMEAAQCDTKDYEKVMSALMERGYQMTKQAVGIDAKCEDGAEQQQQHSPHLGQDDAHIALVKYCDAYLRQKEEEESSVECPSMDVFPTAMVTSLLSAMKNGSVEARQRFPRLLQIVEYYPETMSLFIKKSSEVPSWMFLGWISQMTALLDKAESPAVQDLLRNLAHLYPQAVVYPFKLSQEGYTFQKTSVGKKSEQVRNQLDEALSKNRLINTFISALEQFGQPNALFRDWMEDANKLMTAKPAQRKQALIIEGYKQMYADLLDEASSSQADLYDSSLSAESVPQQVGMGPYRQRFAKEFIKKVDQVCGKDGKKMLEMSHKDFGTKIQDLYRKMDAAVKNTPALNPPTSLKQYCGWLAEFEASRFDEELEIPGQYTGQCKPLPEYHTKISSFDQKIMVMSSIRKPKRLTIRGNDERDYNYLVKGGEDLRLDQRIEQLFAIMNQIFQQDANCKQRHLQLRTYQVIPMTPRVGLIEWMDGTIPLKNFLYDALTEQENKFVHSNRGPNYMHNSWIDGSDPKSYQQMYQKSNRSDTETQFRRRQDLVPWDLSRRAYRSMSASLEAFFTLRSNYAVTHALVSVCQYILGIGDRHLSNFMIDLETGSMVGIDFGHAFGSATQFLPIPELMPFRLTRQLRNLCLPLKEKGLLEGTMIHALRAMRNHSDLLLATMDVFIKEPSLDWQANADKQRKQMSSFGVSVPDEELDLNWFPRQKVAYARKKLQGYNPAYITKEELTLGHRKNPAFASMVKVALGEKQFDVRARMPQKDLSVEQQVACLLNQATDPNILGRVWVGWESWM